MFQSTSRRVFAAALVALPIQAHAADTLYPTAVAPIRLTGTYAQDFDTLASTGTSSVLPTGWQVFEGGTNGNATYAASDGSATAGNAYSFGTTGSGERALGSIGSGNLAPVYYAAFFTNGLGAAITGLDLAYTGELWRSAVGEDGLFFQYSLDATNADNGTWTDFSTLDFVSPTAATTGAVDGNAAANRVRLTGLLGGLNIASGANFAVRWMDLDTRLTDDGVAVDDFSMSAVTAAVPEPASWAMMIGGFGMIGLGARRRRPTRVAFG